MPTEPIRTTSRLIPVSGIGSVQEAEQRATSAFLAVLSVVRDLSLDLLSPFGASKAQKATVETFIEVNTPGQKIRPDGLIQVSFGAKKWSAFVEVVAAPHGVPRHPRPTGPGREGSSLLVGRTTRRRAGATSHRDLREERSWAVIGDFGRDERGSARSPR